MADKDIAQVFKDVFGGVEGRKVLGYLMNYCGYYNDFLPDCSVEGHQERRKVINHILKMLYSEHISVKESDELIINYLKTLEDFK